MKPIELGQEVLSAQGQILSRSAMRIGRRVACALVAVVFLLFAAISFHGFLWAFFISVAGLSYVKASLCVIGIDLFFVLIFAVLAAWSIPDVVEIEARIRRDRKLVELKQSVAITAVTGLLLGPIGRFTGKSFLSILKSFFSHSK
ncbi:MULTISPECIES: hypothetical protein [Gluconobacter]|uniref:Uncharacterized protein n=1 Tax=Gluconobacter cerinus TaxID=38307 RepID=A0A1B6VK80_9PROT|nr:MULTISPECIES: hypothetical protein [Gluconobacter]OAJ67458.1 hypothetical protein A0123_02058 [Gluconobacter cerinus]GFE96250.1 hypothetical protein DmGdi_13230 [Gluconobacter sp. Gdi]